MDFEVKAGLDASDALADALDLPFKGRTLAQHHIIYMATAADIKAACRKLQERGIRADFAAEVAQMCQLDTLRKQSERDHATEPKQQYGGEATRSVTTERYDLIPAEIDQLLAQRFALGAEKHGEGNWKTGDWTFIVSCYNHARAHEVKLRLNGPFTDDDNLAAILWNWGVLAWFRKHRQEEYERAMSFIGNY